VAHIHTFKQYFVVIDLRYGHLLDNEIPGLYSYYNQESTGAEHNSSIRTALYQRAFMVPSGDMVLSKEKRISLTVTRELLFYTVATFTCCAFTER
jgi:hypothetical protein